MNSRSSRRGPRKQLIRESDGKLHDLTTEQGITASELRDFITAGGFFEARRQDGTECTTQVLTEALQDAIAGRRRDRPGPWGSSGPTGPLGPLGGVLGAMPGPAALEPLAQMLSLWGSLGGMPGHHARRQRDGGPERRTASPRAPRPRAGGLGQ